MMGRVVRLKAIIPAILAARTLFMWTLSREWAGCKIAASFYRFDQEIDAAPVIGENCMIPDSVTDYREFEVSLVGVRKGYRITTNRVKIEQEV